MKKEMNLAEFYLENGNHIKIYHKADVKNMIDEYEEAIKNNGFFGLCNWDEDIKGLWYNGRRINSTNFAFPVSKVDLHKFEG